MGPLHWKQHPVGEHAKPPLIQQSPVEEPLAHTAQEQQWRRWRPGPCRPRDWERGADCDQRRRPVAPAGLPLLCTRRRRTSLSRGLLTGWKLGGGSCQSAQPPCGLCPGALWNATPSTYLPPLLFPSVQKPSVISALAAEIKQLHLGTWELILGAGLPLPEKTGEQERGASAMFPSGPGSHCDRRPSLRPEHFSVSHLTADLRDETHQHIWNSKEMGLGARAQTRAWEKVPSILIIILTIKIIINLFNFSIWCTRPWI